VSNALTAADKGDVQAISIGSQTLWGRVAAIGLIGGERYYWMVDKNSVSTMPACVVEA